MDPLSTTFAALADPTRRAILARLAEGETTVGELAQPFDISLPAISRHLEHAGLVERAVAAQWRRCRLTGKPLLEANEFLEQYRRFWEESLDRLADLLETRPTAKRRKRRKR
jgi:DNA-binding transcriptional ArsR family regulator